MMIILLCRFKRCHISYLYKDVIKDSHVHHAVQYCISVKDKENRHLSKVTFGDITLYKWFKNNIF